MKNRMKSVTGFDVNDAVAAAEGTEEPDTRSRRATPASAHINGAAIGRSPPPPPPSHPNTSRPIGVTDPGSTATACASAAAGDAVGAAGASVIADATEESLAATDRATSAASDPPRDSPGPEACRDRTGAAAPAETPPPASAESGLLSATPSPPEAGRCESSRFADENVSGKVVEPRRVDWAAPTEDESASGRLSADADRAARDPPARRPGDAGAAWSAACGLRWTDVESAEPEGVPEPDAPAEPLSSAKAAGIAATAAPIPSATARAPTRPTYDTAATRPCGATDRRDPEIGKIRIERTLPVFSGFSNDFDSSPQTMEGWRVSHGKSRGANSPDAGRRYSQQAISASVPRPETPLVRPEPPAFHTRRYPYAERSEQAEFHRPGGGPGASAASTHHCLSDSPGCADPDARRRGSRR